MQKQSIFAALSLLWVVGCVSQARQARAPKAVAQFPGRDELASVQARPIDSAAFIPNAVRIEQWDIDPATIPAPGAAVDGVVREVSRDLWGERAEATAALTCAARELGRMELEKGGTPGEGAQIYAFGRCGSSLPGVKYSSFESKVPEKVTDAELWAQLSKELKGKKPAKVPEGVALETGVALVRKGERALFAMAGGHRHARLEPVARVPAGQNEVVLRGDIGQPTESIHGLVNLGTHRYAHCRPDPVAPPAFVLRCPVDPGDGSAWINVMARPPKKLLAHLSLRVMATREGARAPYAPVALPSKAQGDFATALVANLNAVRAQARMAPLRLSAEQTAVNTRLSGSILGSFKDEKDGAADRLAMGLLAGWDVAGMIRNGDLLALISSSTADPATWLVEAIEQPMSRSSLLDPDSRVIAVGAAPNPGHPGMGAVITTYALFESDDDSPQVAKIFEQLNLARARRGLAPAALQGAQPLNEAAARVFAGKQDTEDALQDALNQIGAQTNTAVQGLTFEAINLDALEFPELFLTPAPPAIAIAVTHHKAPGAAWGQYAVLIALFPGGAQQQARADAPAAKL